jgi:hypothetical protein
MSRLCTQFWNDEAGFIVSAELILISTIAVLSLVVGLTEVASGINQELEDVATAFGSINQSYKYHGLASCKGQYAGSAFKDSSDDCDSEHDIVCDSKPAPEGRHW